MKNEVEQYVDTATDERKPLYERLQALIMTLFPDIRVVMSAQIPTYRSKTGWVALGYQDDGVSLYTNGPQHVVDFKKANPEIKTGKSNIDLKTTDEVSDASIQAVLKHALEPEKTPGVRSGNRFRG